MCSPAQVDVDHHDACLYLGLCRSSAGFGVAALRLICASRGE